MTSTEETFVPWRKNRIVQEVLKDFSVGRVGRFRLQDFRGFGAEAARAFICPLGIGLCGFRLLLLVSNPFGSNPYRDLQLWRRKRRRGEVSPFRWTRTSQSGDGRGWEAHVSEATAEFSSWWRTIGKKKQHLTSVSVS